MRREGRITPGQQRALENLWPRFGIEPDSVIDPQALFGRRAPLEVEIGCGNGDALIEMASSRPDHDFIGIEVYRPGVGKLLAGLDAAGLANARVSHTDAVHVVDHCLPASSVHRFLVLFPDPWPKKRHHKRRLLQAPFVRLLAERLAPGGELVIATDWADYAEFALQIVTAEPLLRHAHGADGFSPRSEARPPTKYERRGERLGHDVFDIIAKRAS